MRVLKILILIVCLRVSAMAQDTPGNNWAQFRGNHSVDWSVAVKRSHFA